MVSQKPANHKNNSNNSECITLGPTYNEFRYNEQFL